LQNKFVSITSKYLYNLINKMERKKQLNETQRYAICKKFDSGINSSIIARELDINFNTVMSVIRKYKETGSHKANKKRKLKKKIIDEKTSNFIKEKIHENVSITLEKYSFVL